MLISTNVHGFGLTFRQDADGVFIDCSDVPSNECKPWDEISSGPRFTIKRGVNHMKRKGWKLLVHPDEDPTFCIFIPDLCETGPAKAILYKSGDPDWPASVTAADPKV